MMGVRIFRRKTTVTPSPLPTADASLGELIPAECRGPGLSPAELAAAQEEAEASFPPDLCELLSQALPTGDGFPDWRYRPKEVMGVWRERLIADFHFDVINNGFWRPDWGERPDDPDDARGVVADQLARVPALIPIFIHRAIPNEPLEPGNPVFSVWQAVDMIVYGGKSSRSPVVPPGGQPGAGAGGHGHSHGPGGHSHGPGGHSHGPGGHGHSHGPGTAPHSH